MRRAGLALLAALVVTALPATASAETGHKSDPSGDAPARIDIKRFEVRNATHRFTARADVRNLRQKGTLTFEYWRGTTGSPPMQSLLVVVDRVDGATRGRFFTCGFEDCAPAHCAGLRSVWRAGQDFVRISAPQRCYPTPRTHPHAPPPAAGRFFVWSGLGKASDHIQGDPLALSRG